MKNQYKKLCELLGLRLEDLKFGFFEPLESVCKKLQNKGKKIVVYGAGSAGRNVMSYLEQKDIEVNFICDSDKNKWNKEIEGIKVLPPDSLLKDKSNFMVVIGSIWERDIASFLKANQVEFVTGFPEIFYRLWDEPFSSLSNHIDEIIETFYLLNDDESKNMFKAILRHMLTRDSFEFRTSLYNQYIHPQINFGDFDFVIDGGSYPGDFIDFVINNSSSTCFGFEPDKENFRFLCEKYKGKQKVNLVKSALWNEDGRMSFFSNSGYDSHLNKNGCQKNNNFFRSDSSNKVKTISIDNFVQKENIEGDIYIKMDIEGAEAKALEGAQNTIKELRPKLAICLYHTPSHIFSIPLYIKRLKPDYNFFIGRHGFDIVMYAL